MEERIPAKGKKQVVESWEENLFWAPEVQKRGQCGLSRLSNGEKGEDEVWE